MKINRMIKERIQVILDEMAVQGITLRSQRAYILATVQHETNGTFLPIKEGYWLKNPDTYLKGKPYYPYYGRGYVQLTWKMNYEKFSLLLGKDLVKEPDLVLEPRIAAFILVYGFRKGSFTGKNLETFVNDEKTDFKDARRCINGTDKAELIAGYAKVWEYKL